MSVKSRFPVYVRAMAFIMLFAMIHYVAGYRLMYSLGILYAKEEAKKCMVEKSSHTQKITIPVSDFSSLKWTDGNKEFSYNNEMYDVVSIQKSGDSYIISVYCDDNETGWVSSLHTYEKEFFHPDQSAKGTRSAESIMSSFQKDFTPPTAFKVPFFSSKGLTQPVLAVQQHILKISISIWHPPVNC